MCAKLIKEGKRLIKAVKFMFIGLFVTKDNWNIATCYQMNQKRGIEKREYTRTIKYEKEGVSAF